MFYADYEQAESRVVAWDAEDSAYIAAHQTGDVHTEVARLVWPAFFEEHRHDTSPHCTTRNNTTQDNTPQQLTNRQIAELPAPWDANHEIRWYSKHVAHGTAIGMTEHGIARDARIKLKEARAARNEFRSRFPRVAARQDEIWQSVLETRTVTSPLGRRRTFRGRIYGMDAGSTRREALAQIQQSMIVDWVSIALCRVWMEMDGRASTPKPSDPCRVWILAQVHDAILGLVRPGDDEALQRVHELMSFHLDLHGRELRIPVEIKIGPSWKHDAMVKWRPGLTWSNTAR
jgi:DNA polymerase I-like protein with 3'-5' exonuclease and polymerase domains